MATKAPITRTGSRWARVQAKVKEVAESDGMARAKEAGKKAAAVGLEVAGDLAKVIVPALGFWLRYFSVDEDTARIHLEEEVPGLSDEAWAEFQERLKDHAGSSDEAVVARAKLLLLRAHEIHRTTR